MKQNKRFFQFLGISIIVSLLITLVKCQVEKFSCEVGSSSGPLLSLKDQDIVYEIDLVLIPSDNQTGKDSISSIKLQQNCKLLTCPLPKFKGDCLEYSESVDKPVKTETFQSFSCKCSESSSVLNSKVEKGLRKARKLGELSQCGELYQDWFYLGHSQPIAFPGSTVKLDVGTIKSAKIKQGCEIMMWKQLGEKQLSLTVGDSLTFIGHDQNTKYEWSCCYCDNESEKVCNNAKNASTLIEKVETQDFSQFVKYGKKIIGIGRNYRWKASELSKVLAVPTEPIVFLKPSTSYIEEGQKIELPESLGTIFYEIELGVVIGKGGKSISKESALDHVAGYFLALDMTAKEFLKKSINQSKPWEIGKGFDTACPVGNFIPKHLIPNPNDVHLECKVNGKITQSDNTRNMIFDVPSLIHYVSRYMTLSPYDVFVTGTPDGLGAIKDGDVIEGTLGNLTTIRFEVVGLKDT